MNAADERDAALAVIEQAKAEALKPSPVLAWSAITRIENVLNQSPASALAKVKADALREAATGLIDWDVLYGHEIGTVEQRESNRNAQWLTSEADRIEKEATS